MRSGGRGPGLGLGPGLERGRRRVTRERDLVTGLGTDTVGIKTDITETGEMTDVTETRITLMSCGDTRRTPADTRNTAGTHWAPVHSDISYK